MSKHSAFALDQHLESFIDRQVEEGNFSSPSDVVGAGLRLLEEHQEKLYRLRAALEEGENSGYATPFDFDEFLARKRSQHGK